MNVITQLYYRYRRISKAIMLYLALSGPAWS